MQLTGIHHLTAITAQAARNVDFYTRFLGLRLVKKTVNQDDVSAYHLFYADGAASPGTDITFFDWPAAAERRGNRSIARTGFRVPAGSLDWWFERVESAGLRREKIAAHGARAGFRFEDFEGQRLLMVEDDGIEPARPWDRSPVPAERQIRGLGPIVLSVAAIEPTARVLTALLGMRQTGEYSSGEGSAVQVFQMGPGGAAAELQVQVDAGAPAARSGAGGVHHVAFRVPNDQEYAAWAQRLAEAGVSNSGPVDRYYFKSLYFREPGGILFELATDGPGFAVDEPAATLGERLALPPFLEGRRAEIEAGLKPLG